VLLEPISGVNLLPQTAVRYAPFSVKNKLGLIGMSGGAMNVSSKLAAVSRGWSAATIILTVNRSNSSGDQIYDGLGGSGSVNEQPYGDGNWYDDFGSTVRQSFAVGSTLVGDHIISLRSRNGQWNFNRDGIQVYSTTSNTFSFSKAGAATMAPGGGPGNFIFYEVILAGVYLTDTELLAVTTYMSNRWRIPIT